MQGTVDVALRDVPWDQALDIILRANKLGYSVDGTIVRIAPNTVLKAEEDERKALAESQNDASQLGTLQRQLSYAKGDEVATLLKSANVLSQARTGQRRSADQHADRHATCPASFPRSPSTHRHARSRAAAGRDRSAHRPDQQDVRARARRAVGLQRPRRPDARQHDQPGVSRTTAASAAAPAARRDRRRVDHGPADRGQPRRRRRRTARVGLALGSVNGAFNLDVALTALESSRQRPPAVDAARDDAEQHRRRDDAGRADSDSDGREQHRDGQLQGRRADA